MIEDVGAAIDRARMMLMEGALITEEGERVQASIHSICVHGDSPRAVEMARRLRMALEDANFTLRAFAPPQG